LFALEWEKGTEMNSEKDHEPPKPGPGDHARALARAGLSAIPVAGGAAVELFNKLITPPLERRRDQWRHDVGEAIARLEADKGVKIDDLQNDESFIDTVMHASLIAMRNSQEEKRKALLNAIRNCALPNPPDASIREIFLELIDTLTVWHLRILGLFQDPPSWLQSNNRDLGSLTTGGLSNVLEAAFPEMQGRRQLYDKLWQDLHTRRLVTTDQLHSTISRSGLMAKRTTELADRFLEFIGEPTG